MRIIKTAQFEEQATQFERHSPTPFTPQLDNLPANPHDKVYREYERGRRQRPEGLARDMQTPSDFSGLELRNTGNPQTNTVHLYHLLRNEIAERAEKSQDSWKANIRLVDFDSGLMLGGLAENDIQEILIANGLPERCAGAAHFWGTDNLQHPCDFTAKLTAVNRYQEGFFAVYDVSCQVKKLSRYASVIAHNPDGRYYYRVHPKGAIGEVLRHGLSTYGPNTGPGAYIDDAGKEQARWPDQDYFDGDPQTSRLYVANDIWTRDGDGRQSEGHPDAEFASDRFRIRIPAHYLEEQLEGPDQFGDYYVDTGESGRTVLEPSQFDIDMGGGQWVRGDMAQNLMTRSWEALHYKPDGFYKVKMIDDPEPQEEEEFTQG